MTERLCEDLSDGVEVDYLDELDWIRIRNDGGGYDRFLTLYQCDLLAEFVAKVKAAKEETDQ